MINKKWLYIKNFPDKFWLILALIITIIVFIPSINYDFLPEWDDYNYVFNKHLGISWANLRYWLTETTQKLYTPVTSYSLMIDYNLFGYDQTGYRVMTLLLHCGSVLLLTAIMKKLGISPLIAAAIALLWAVHPQRIPSVVWISERKDVLVVFFALASLYAYICACKKSKYSIAAPIFLLLSLGAKPAAVGLPVVMLIYTLWQHRKHKWCKLSLVIPSFVILIFYLCWFFYIQSSQHIPSEARESFYLLQKFWIVSHNAMWYLCSAFVPFQLNPIYPRVSPFSMEYLPLIFGFIILVKLFSRIIFKAERLSFKLKIYLFASFVLCWGALFLPVSGIVTIGMVDYADRYNYLPSIVMWIMIAIFITWQSHNKWISQKDFRKIPSLIFLIILCFYWYSNWSYMPVWENSSGLFVKAVEWQYPNPKAIDNLGTVGINKSNTQLLELASGKYLFIAVTKDSLPYYPEQIKKNVWLPSGLFLGAYALFLQEKYNKAFPILVNLRKQGQTMKFYNENGYKGKFWGSLASCYLHYKKPVEALQCLKNQLKILKPGTFDALFNQGLTSFTKKDFISAEKYWKAANKIRPNDKKVIYNIKVVQKLQAKKAAKLILRK